MSVTFYAAGFKLFMLKPQPRQHYFKLIFSLILFIAIGLLSKFYRGPLQQWINDDVNGIFYVVCWALLFAFFFAQKSLKFWVISALIWTCILECLQLSQAWWLLELRGYTLGRLILGSHFAWQDFPYYILGAAVAWFWLKQLQLNNQHQSLR